jgi:hypothetical protein
VDGRAAYFSNPAFLTFRHPFSPCERHTPGTHQVPSANRVAAGTYFADDSRAHTRAEHVHRQRGALHEDSDNMSCAVLMGKRVLDAVYSARPLYSATLSGRESRGDDKTVSRRIADMAHHIPSFCGDLSAYTAFFTAKADEIAWPFITAETRLPARRWALRPITHSSIASPFCSQWQGLASRSGAEL